MKPYLLLSMFLFIVYLSIQEKDTLKRMILLSFNIDIKKLLLFMGYLYIGIYFVLIINASSQILIPIFLIFIIGEAFVIYAKSKHFNRIYIIRFLREQVDNINPKISNSIIYKANVAIYCRDMHEPISNIQDLTDTKGNIVFRTMDFGYIKEFCLQWASENIERDSIPYFSKLLLGEDVEEKIRLKSIAKKSKEFTYRPLFNLFNQITYLGVSRLVSFERRNFINFICSNFTKGEENISSKMLNPRFSTWKKQHNIGE